MEFKTHLKIGKNPTMTLVEAQIPIIPGIESIIDKVNRWKSNENYVNEVSGRCSELLKVLYNQSPEIAEQIAVIYIYFYFRTNSTHENPFSETATKNSGRSNSIGLPYGMKPGPNGKGGSFNPGEFPIDLQAMLQIFMKMVNP